MALLLIFVVIGLVLIASPLLLEPWMRTHPTSGISPSMGNDEAYRA